MIYVAFAEFVATTVVAALAVAFVVLTVILSHCLRLSTVVRFCWGCSSSDSTSSSISAVGSSVTTQGTG